MCTRRKTLTSLLLLVCFCFVLIFILFCIIVIQYESMVGPSTQLYDSGVELTSDGLYGRHDYLKHATRGTLSLHSLYLLLWSNFASFSLSFLTQPEAEKNISGKLLSKTVPAREFCVGQMKKLWILLGTHCKKKSVQCTPNMVCYVCPNWNTLYGVKSHHILGVCLTPNWVCFHTNSVCFPTNFSVFSHSL